MYQRYKELHVRAGFQECLTGAINLIVKNPFYFLPMQGKTVGLIFGAVIMILLVVFMQYTYAKLRVHHDINTLKGSAKWGDVKEFTDRMAEWDDEKHQHLGFYNAIFSDTLRMSLNYKHHTHTMNTLVLGTTGTGKSYTVIKPNLAQMNASFVITDPKGELLLSCGETLRRFGYNVRVFDLVAMGNCCAYNPMKYCYKESDINKLVKSFMINTSPEGKEGGSKDPFWDDATSAFLCACIALLTQYCNPDIYEDKLGPFDRSELIADVDGKPYDFVPNFATLCELTRMANRVAKGATRAQQQNNTANASELNIIFERIRERYKDELEKPYCLRMWDNFKLAPEKTSTTILMTTATKLQAFNIEQVAKLTSYDTINLDTFGNSKDALFVITPVNDSTYNFLVSFLYTQLFDILYTHGEKECEGSLDLILKNGDLVHHFSKEEVSEGGTDEVIKSIQNAQIRKVEGEIYEGHKKVKGKGLFGKTKNVSVKFDDSYYEIMDSEWNDTMTEEESQKHLISRRPTKSLAEQYLKDLKSAKKRIGKGTRIPCHVRFLLDEFPNICTIPDFKEKLSTMRSYEISCVIICQTITQLKGKYEKDYEVIDANCPEVVFLGGTENTNNDYLSKKIGNATVKGYNNSVDAKKTSSSYNVEQRSLMSPDELGKMAPRHNIVIIDGEDPIYDKTFDFQKHMNYQYTHDYANDIGTEEAMTFSRQALVEEVEIAEKLNSPKFIQKPIAVPTVEELTDETFMSYMLTRDGSKVLKNMRNNEDFFNSSYVGVSEAGAF